MTSQKLKIDRTPQVDFFSDLAKPENSQKNKQSAQSGRVFISPDPEDIYLGSSRLRQHLQQAQQSAPFIVADILNGQDWSVFEARYADSGRPPYAPRNMVGLILYGIMEGITSLRALERLARLNLGCMWVSGGVFPDHANIGRFINLHAQSLTGDFFDALAVTVLKKTGSTGQCLAGDGTTIEAACSNYNLIKEEAAKKAFEDARKQSEKEPESPEKQASLEQTREVYDTLLAQKEKRKRRSQKSAENTRISPTEPGAILQKMKRNRGYAPGYTPSILVNDKRVVVAQAVDPTSETLVIPEMLDQAVRTTGQNPEELLLDGGYPNETVITTSLERNISLLCPESGRPDKPKKGKKFHKSQFRYDPINDVYQCPANQKLALINKPRDPSRSNATWVYGGASCQTCPLKNQCTTSGKTGRRIKRRSIDDAKDALRETMQHPAAKKVYKKRQAMVEPVFGYLRNVQGLNRFRRRGLDSVKLEFSLHLLAYNLNRVVTTCFYCVFIRFWCIWARYQSYYSLMWMSEFDLTTRPQRALLK